MIQFLVMDGRAIHDINQASVMEAFSAISRKAATKYFRYEYSGYDAVLVKSTTMEIVFVGQ